MGNPNRLAVEESRRRIPKGREIVLSYECRL